MLQPSEPMYEHSWDSYKPCHWGSSTGDLLHGAGATVDSKVLHQMDVANGWAMAQSSLNSHPAMDDRELS